MSTRFVHLHVHSEYSLSNGLIRINDVIATAASSGMPAIGMTDHANIYGLVKFYRAALAEGVKPILGVDAWIENEQNPSAPTRLTLLVKDNEGYRNLCRLLGKAYGSAQHGGKACIRKTWFENFGSGLIALSGAQDGDLGWAIRQARAERVHQLVDEYCAIFDNRFYIELRRVGKSQEEQYNSDAIALAASKGLPVVATNDVNFLKSEDFHNHEIRVCIHEGRILSDQRRPRNFTDQQYFRSADEMAELFSDVPEAIENSVEIAKRCNPTMDMGTYHLPKFDVGEDVGVETVLTDQANKGLAMKFEEFPGIQAQTEIYNERLQLELDIIVEMGFAGYFLIVADFINWAKLNDIPVGPGRGSGAGSLVAWTLGITELDPIHHGLLFERFLNPERVSLPDFDIDFCMDGRDRVIEYVAEKYGRDKVSQIITHGTMAARAVVRDVGRVLGMPYGYVDQVAKLIPFAPGMTLDDALKQEELLAQRYEQEEEIKELLDISRDLEGLSRNVGKHAGGVVIAPSVLTDFTGLYCEQGSPQMLTHFDKNDLEAIGLVKFDFLGLRTLTIIHRAVNSINRSRNSAGQEAITIKELPTDDSRTFDLLKSCKTTALFQLESRGMKELINRMQPDKFNDLVALVALFRPGPLQSGMVDDFIDRKHGRGEITYPHPLLEPILKPTYGVILYQEQVMEIARALAGYSLGSADLLREAMGKKKVEKMAVQRSVFLEGAVNNQVDAKLAEDIFDLMEKFAGYGFNKSHSAAYALITYQTAWLKAHYPAFFMAACLSADMENTDRVVTLIAECRDMGLEVVPPNINLCQFYFETADSALITYGLGAIKGLGFNVIDAIIESRNQSGKFESLFDFCTRVDGRKINKRALESLIQAGAMDDLGPHRASLMATLPLALDLSNQKSQNKRAGQSDLFGVEAPIAAATKHAQVAEWNEEEILDAEKNTLGLYLSGHPINKYRGELDQMIHARLADLNPDRDRSIVVAGLVVAMRTMNTKRGGRMAFVTLDDETARMELAVFSDLFSENRETIRKDNLLVVHGQVTVDDFTGGYKMSAESVFSIEQARAAFAHRITVTIDQNVSDLTVIERIVDVLNNASRGGCRVVLHYRTADEEGKLAVGDNHHVTVNSWLLESLSELVGTERVWVEYNKQPAEIVAARVESAA